MRSNAITNLTVQLGVVAVLSIFTPTLTAAQDEHCMDPCCNCVYWSGLGFLCEQSGDWGFESCSAFGNSCQQSGGCEMSLTLFDLAPDGSVFGQSMSNRTVLSQETVIGVELSSLHRDDVVYRDCARRITARLYSTATVEKKRQQSALIVL